MEGAASLVGVLWMTLDEHVPRFRMDEAMEQLSIAVQAHADTGAYGHVGHHRASHAGAVYRFPQGRPVHVGIKFDGYRKGPGKGTYEIHVLPALLRGGFDIPVGGRIFLQVQRPETCNAQGFDGILFEPVNNFREHLGRRGGGEPHFRKDPDFPVPHFTYAANNFGTACFYAAD